MNWNDEMFEAPYGVPLLVGKWDESGGWIWDRAERDSLGFWAPALNDWTAAGDWHAWALVESPK